MYRPRLHGRAPGAVPGPVLVPRQIAGSVAHRDEIELNLLAAWRYLEFADFRFPQIGDFHRLAADGDSRDPDGRGRARPLSLRSKARQAICGAKPNGPLSVPVSG